MSTLIWATWVGWLRSPMRVTAVLLIVVAAVFLPSLSMVLSPDGEMASLNGLTFLVTGAGLLFNFSTGIVAKEREQGLLATIFARPIKRSTYVFSKWLALGLGVWLVNLAVGLLTLVVYLVNRPDLILWSEFLSSIVTSLFLILGTSSLLVLCSTIGAATSELTLFSMAFSTALISLAISTMAQMKTGGEHGWILLVAQGQHLLKEVCTVVSGPLWFLLFPYIRFPLDAALAPQTLFTYASNVGLALLLAVWTINRREVGYGNA